MNHEDLFAEEAQEEILHRESQNQQQSKQAGATVQNVDENSPLVDSASIRGSRMSHRRGYSYQRAINEPWTGAYGAGDRPWYKKPSVSGIPLLNSSGLLTLQGILAATSFLSLLHRFWWNHCAKDIPHSGFDM